MNHGHHRDGHALTLGEQGAAPTLRIAKLTQDGRRDGELEETAVGRNRLRRDRIAAAEFVEGHAVPVPAEDLDLIPVGKRGIVQTNLIANPESGVHESALVAEIRLIAPGAQVLVAFPDNGDVLLKQDLDGTGAGLTVTGEEIEIHLVHAHLVVRHGELDLIVRTDQIARHLLLADEDVFNHHEVLALQGDDGADVLGSRHLIHDDERVIAEGDGLFGFHGLTVRKGKHDLARHRSVVGLEGQFAVGELDTHFLAAKGRLGHQIKVSALDRDGFTGHQFNRRDLGHHGMDQRVSDGNGVPVVHGQGDFTLRSLGRNIDKDALFTVIIERSLTGTGERNGGDHINVVAADRQILPCLDGLRGSHEVTRLHHLNGTGNEFLAGIIDRGHVTGLRRGGDRHRERLAVGGNSEVRDLGASGEDDLADHVQVFTLDDDRLVGLGNRCLQAADGRIADRELILGIHLVGHGIGIQDFVGVSQDQTAGDGIRGNDDLELITRLGHEFRHVGSPFEDNLLDQVQIISLDGQFVTGHCRCRAEGSEDDGLGISKLGHRFDLGAVLTDDGNLALFRSVHREGEDELALASGTGHGEIRDGIHTGNQDLGYLVQITADDGDFPSTIYRIGRERTESEAVVTVLISADFLVLAAGERQESGHGHCGELEYLVHNVLHLRITWGQHGCGRSQ